MPNSSAQASTEYEALRKCQFSVSSLNGTLWGYLPGRSYEDGFEYIDHFAVGEHGDKVRINFSPFKEMEIEDFTRFVDLGLPRGPGILTSQKLRAMMAIKMGIQGVSMTW